MMNKKEVVTSPDAIEENFTLDIDEIQKDRVEKRKATDVSDESPKKAPKKDHKAIIASKKGEKKERPIITSLTQEEQAAWMNKVVQDHFKNIWSSLEFKSNVMKDEYIFNTRSLFDKEHSISNLQAFIQLLLPDWKESLSKDYNKVNGQPTVLMITLTALKATDIIRALPDINQACKIMKIFAKHFKISEQIDYLSKNPVRFAVGTPHRVSQLESQGHLDVSKVRWIILDASKDHKQRDIFQSDITKELLEFIFTQCFSQLKSYKTQLILY